MELGSSEIDLVVQNFADLGLIMETTDQTQSRAGQYEAVEEYGVHLHDLIHVLCLEMAGNEQEEWHTLVIDALKRSKLI